MLFTFLVLSFHLFLCWEETLQGAPLQSGQNTFCRRARGNCMRRDSSGLMGELGCRAERVEVCGTLWVPCPHRLISVVSQAMLPNYSMDQLCVEPNSFMVGSSISFLPSLSWVVVVFSSILFIFCQWDRFLIMRSISLQMPQLQSIIVVQGQKKRVEKRNECEMEDCTVLL